VLCEWHIREKFEDNSASLDGRRYMERLDRKAQPHIQTYPQIHSTATTFTRQGKPDLIIAQDQIETIEDDVTFPNIHYK